MSTDRTKSVNLPEFDRTRQVADGSLIALKSIKRQPDPPRGIRFLRGTIFWDDPEHHDNVTHYNIYAGDENNHYARVPSKTTCYTGIRAQRVFISSFNEASGLESRKIPYNNVVYPHPPDIYSGFTHREIQFAIDDMHVEGGTVLLGPGTWEIGEPVEVYADKPSLRIMGSGDATIIARRQDMASGYGVFNVRANGCRISDMVIDGGVTVSAGIEYADLDGDPLHADLADNTSIWVHGGVTGTRIERLTVRHTGGYAVVLDARTDDVIDTRIERCTFENNRPHLFGDEGDTTYGSWTGGVIYRNDGASPATSRVSQLHVSGCTWRRNTGRCLWGYGDGFDVLNEEIRISDNIFEYSGLEAILTSHTSRGLICGNVIRKVGYTHATDEDTPSASVRAATFSSGIRVGGDGILVSGNSIDGCEQGAISLYDANQCVIDANSIVHSASPLLFNIPILIVSSGVTASTQSTENVIQNNSINWDIGTLNTGSPETNFCIHESDAFASPVPGPNYVFNNRIFGNNHGEWLHGATSSSSSNVSLQTNEPHDTPDRISRNIIQREGFGDSADLKWYKQYYDTTDLAVYSRAIAQLADYQSRFTTFESDSDNEPIPETGTISTGTRYVWGDSEELIDWIRSGKVEADGFLSIGKDTFENAQADDLDDDHFLLRWDYQDSGILEYSPTRGVAVPGQRDWYPLTTFPPGGNPGGDGLCNVIQEIPSGTIGAGNYAFTTTFTPQPQYVWVQQRLSGGTRQIMDPFFDYSLSGKTVTYTAGSEPVSGDAHWFWYFYCEGEARRFSGVNTDLIDWGTSSVFNITGDMSLGIWFMMPSGSPSGDNLIVRGMGTGGGSDSTKNSAYAITTWSSGGKWDVAYGHDSGTKNPTGNFNKFATQLDPDTWYYVGISRDSAAKSVSMWTIDESGTVTSHGSFNYAENTSDGTNASNGLAVGGYRNGETGAAGEGPIQADVQEHYISTEIWTSDQHLSAARGNPPLTGLVLSVPSLGTNPEVDVSGTGASGSVSGTTLVNGHDPIP